MTAIETELKSLDEPEFGSWLCPVPGEIAYTVLTTDSTAIALYCSSTNIALNKATDGLNKWVAKWLH